MSAAPWLPARGLSERAAAPRPGARDEVRARRWAESLGGDAALAARLACTGLTPRELPAVLAHDGERAADDRPPGWWNLVTATLGQDDRGAVPDASDEEDADVPRGAVRLVAPFARRAHAALRAHPEGGDGAARAIAEALATELAELAVPTLATELVLARAVEGWDAADATRRAADMLRALGRPERALALFAEVPGLARLIAERTRLAEEAGIELLNRVAADRPRVRDELLGGEDPGPLVAVSASGDSHDGGRRVSRLTFASGAGAVLKPRPMAADAAFQRLLGALGDAGFEPAFRPLRTVCTGPNHGWQELARPAACATESEVDAYFRRLGGQLAALHALRATDMHQENVLACGEHPVLVDLETVLHPRLGGARARTVDPLIAETGLDCVLRVGLLPRADAAFGVDMSGLGRDPDVVHVGERFAWAGAGADARLVRREQRLEAGENAPRLHDTPVAPAHHVDALEAGFAAAYELLVEHRDRWLAAGGPLAAFAGVPVRFVLRPTKVYADLLRRQAHAREGLVDGLAREEALNVLWRGAARRSELAAAAPAEHDDLWLGDVPKVGGHAGSADASHHLHGRLPGLLDSNPAPGPEIVRRLDTRDLERQLGFVRASVLAGAADGCVAPAHGAPGELGAADHATAAGAAGRRLAVLALHEGPEAGWLAPVTRPPAGGRVLRPVDMSLRHGQTGIALLLARLHAVAGDARAGELARAALRRLEHERPPGGREPAVRLLTLSALADMNALAPAALLAAATELAESVHSGAPPSGLAIAPGLAVAVAVLGPDARLAAAARAAADAAATHGAIIALVAHTAAARAAAGSAEEAGARAALGAALTRTNPAEGDGPTTRHLDGLVGRADAQRVLGGSRCTGAPALSAAQRQPTFWGGVESPILEDGLAGIGLARLALIGDEPAARAVTAAIILRAESAAGDQASAD